MASYHGLKGHLKLHEEREVEAGLDADSVEEADGEGDEGETRPRKQRRGGEMGRDWKCEIEGFGKDFKLIRHSRYLFLFVTIYSILFVGAEKSDDDPL